MYKGWLHVGQFWVKIWAIWSPGSQKVSFLCNVSINFPECEPLHPDACWTWLHEVRLDVSQLLAKVGANLSPGGHVARFFFLVLLSMIVTYMAYRSAPSVPPYAYAAYAEKDPWESIRPIHCRIFQESFSNSQMDLLHSIKPTSLVSLQLFVFCFQGSWGKCELEVAVYAALGRK